jgi:hypothetical protein
MYLKNASENLSDFKKLLTVKKWPTISSVPGANRTTSEFATTTPALL